MKKVFTLLFALLGVSMMSYAETEVALTVKKDGSAYTSHGKTFSLYQGSDSKYTGSGTDGTVTFSGVSDGTYDIYEGTADTGVDAIVSSDANSFTVDYYTVTFTATKAGEATDASITATYDDKAIASGDVLIKGKKLVLTANGSGASEYTYFWLLQEAASSSFEKSFTINQLISKCTFLCSVTGKNTTPPSIYHTIHLEVADGIELYNQTAGDHQVEDGSHLYLQFLPEDRTLTADDVLFLIDGIETSFNDFGGGNYYSHILNPIEQDHTILIALREYPVTLTETEGVTYSIGAGTHQVAYGEKFTFSLTLAEGIDPADVHIFANGIEIEPDALRAAVLTYTIDKVISPITVVIEGTGDVTGNANIAESDITLSIVNCQLSIVNSGSAVDVAIYNVGGQNVVSLRALRGSKTLSLEPGIYLVKAGDKVYKVSVY